MTGDIDPVKGEPLSDNRLIEMKMGNSLKKNDMRSTSGPYPHSIEEGYINGVTNSSIILLKPIYQHISSTGRSPTIVNLLTLLALVD